MNHNAESIKDLLGLHVDLSQELIRAIIDFTLVFSLTEQKLMDGEGAIGRTDKYAKDLVDNYGMNADNEFNYFHRRYILDEDAKHHLDSLCPDRPRDREKVHAALVKIEPSNFDKVNAVLKVCLRLRHNLFHGNKWQYNLRGQEHNLNTVTHLFSRYLNRLG
ncbi:hypothetical protein AB4K01_15150 [Serratia fonticola]|uniref:hypothetical protein n=1 Tax=Serratia fonticola TaxID=47917 RepID=UPI0034C674BB